MKKFNSLTILIFIVSQVLAQVPEDIYFIAGMPDTKFYQDNPSQIYTANIIEYENDTLKEVLVLSDSSQILNYLLYYPDLSTVVVLNENKLENSAERTFDLLEVSINNFSAEYQTISNNLDFNGINYKDYRFELSVVRDRNLVIQPYFEYFTRDDNPIIPKRLFGTLENNKFIVEDISLKASILPNGSMAGPFFGSNCDILFLQAHPTKRLLVIPSYLKEDSIFHTVIPEDAVLTPMRYSASMVINTNQIRLMYYYKGKDGKPFYDLYNKEQDRYYQYPFDNSNQNVKQFGNWIAGPTRLQYVDNGSYQGSQPGQDMWSPNHNKYGLSVAEYIDRNLKTVILSGYLAIRNINDPSVFIEWDTGQGDSEILGIHDETVYYRKHDEVWYTPIVDGAKLGEHQMLLKDEVVPGIHFMFVQE